MKLTLTFDEAKALHQNYFPGDFKICQLVNKNFEGCFCTDGEKFVLTKKGFLNAAKIANKYEFAKDDVECIKNSKYITSFYFKDNRGQYIANLNTSKGVIQFCFFALLVFTLGLAFPLYFLRKSIYRRAEVISIERPLFGSFENTPKDHLIDFNEFMEKIGNSIVQTAK